MGGVLVEEFFLEILFRLVAPGQCEGLDGIEGCPGNDDRVINGNEGLRFGVLGFFRVLDPRGRVVLYYSCEPTSSSDASSPLSVFDGAFIVAMDVSEQGDLVDIEFVFDNGYRIQVFDMDPWETWSLSLEGVVLHGA